MATAFQPNAFQNNAFQITPSGTINPNIDAINPGGAIVGGTFSKGQWHSLKEEIALKKRKRRDEIEALRLAEAAAAEAAQAKLAAQVAQQRDAEDKSLAGRLKALLTGGPTPQQRLAAIAAFNEQAARQHAAMLMAQAKAKQDDEDAAMAALLGDE